MTQIWSAYSCNNSGAYRLVARFTDPVRAVGAELREKSCGGLYDPSAFP